MNRTQQNRKNVRGDRIIVRGAVELAISTGSSGNGIFSGSSPNSLSPASLGGRPSIFGELFTRYRFVSLGIKYIPHIGSTTAGALAIGFLDDTLASGSENLTDYLATVQLRTTFETQVWSKAGITWKPIDKEKWYYTQTESSAGDNRLVNQTALIGNGIGLSASTVYGSLIVSYVIEFEGALPNSTT
jgi:hypothetical protein